MKKKHLPETMGGDFKFESFQEWMGQRMTLEVAREQSMAIMMQQIPVETERRDWITEEADEYKDNGTI